MANLNTFNRRTITMPILREKRISLAALAEREGFRIATIFNWADTGSRGVKLESFCIGKRRFTSEEAFDRFVEACSAQ
jgi:hypothetical protein